MQTNKNIPIEIFRFLEKYYFELEKLHIDSFFKFLVSEKIIKKNLLLLRHD